MKKNHADFLVVGAGLAGLAFAADMKEAGATVRLVDKGRGLGGRMATRRLTSEGVTVPVDHGAQFFTARGERLKKWAESGIAEQWLGIWSYGFPLWKEGILHTRSEGHPRFAPFAGMNDLAKRLGRELEVMTGMLVQSIERTSDGFEAKAEDGRVVSGDSLILNLPPTQLLGLARNLLSTTTISEIESVDLLPAWVMMALLDKDIEGAAWSAMEFEGHPILGWLSRDHTKRPGNVSPTLVALGSGEWSRTNLEKEPSVVQEILLEAITKIVGNPGYRVIQVHRWRYALPVHTIGVSFLWDSANRIGCCGDWCGSSRVEGALESGWNLAAAVNQI